MSLSCRHWWLRKQPMRERWQLYRCTERLHLQMCYRIHGCQLWNKYVRPTLNINSMKKQWNHTYINDTWLSWRQRIIWLSNVYCYFNVVFAYPNNDCDQFVNWIWFVFLLIYIVFWVSLSLLLCSLLLLLCFMIHSVRSDVGITKK